MKNRKNREIIGVILILISFLLLIGFYSNTNAFLLVFVKNLIKNGIGAGGFALPFLVGFIGVLIISNKNIKKLNKKFYALITFFITIYLIISLMSIDSFEYNLNTRQNYGFLESIQRIINTDSYFHGGILGLSIMKVMKIILGNWGSLVFLISLNLISVILFLDKSIYEIYNVIKEKVLTFIAKVKNKNKKYTSIDYSNKTINKETKNTETNKEKQSLPIDKKKKSNASIVKFLSKSLSIEEPKELNEKKDNYEEVKKEENIEKSIEENVELKSPTINYENTEDETKLIYNPIKKEKDIEVEKTIEDSLLKKEDLNETATPIYEDTEINIDYLEDSKESLSEEFDEELRMKKELLQRTLNNFKVRATIKNVEKGPAVTRYEIEPDEGVKVSKIVNLSDDIALALATSGIRIESPIPGKALVGIEVPNNVISTITLKEIIKSDEFNSAKLKISIGLGKDISGKSIVADLATMPHLLIAGATGSGKSVCINTILISILYNYLPDEVKLILIDPKVVELNVYNGIPHLLIPVVTDPKKASNALNWAITEMTRRYNIFAEKGVRNIYTYNELYDKKEITEKLPYIVIIIDELADLMMVCHNEVEDSIARLAQMARAAGMHLIIATQRPSVDIITGVIKANIPSRISFSVSSSIDSRTILDQSGAEKLLGRGDMLFYPMGYLKPQRIQGAFISEREVEQFVNEIKKKYKSKIEYNEEILEHINNLNVRTESEDFDDEELLREAIKIILENNNTSTSLVQRKLKIGYNRAASIVEELEKRGIIGYRGSSNKREILVDEEDL